MNYSFLMKLIADSKVPENEETDAIRELVGGLADDISQEKYDEEIGKYLSGQSKTLYC